MKFTQFGLILSLFASVSARALDLKDASIAAAPDLTGPERKAVEMLRLEVEARTGLRWLARGANPAEGPVISVRHGSGTRPAEGFRLIVRDGRVEIQGNDERGTLFGVGRLLRELRWGRGSATIDDNLDITSSPQYPLRGHQIGYRPKVNTYDAWTPAVFEQYVRDLAVFGTNAIELIPPRSDDDDQSPHFHLPKIEMMVEMSRIIASYGLAVWIWFPAMDKDYRDPKTVEFAIKEWGAVFEKLPSIDAVFVPGGDPGNASPAALMNLLEKQSGVLRKSHPRAQMWVSPQGWDAPRMSEFLNLVKAEPRWLDGVVYGPWTRLSLPELRAGIPARYPIRRYPDITHSIHSQYPIPGWDVAYAVTEGRETINPRPVDQAKIFRLLSPRTIGFITYSEGVNDDLNKIVWSSLGWNPEADVTGILREYARYFISPARADEFAQGLLSLEQNWRGPLLSNTGVDRTLLQFRSLERSATPQMLRNWRFQQALYRAYYDGYVHDRLVYESGLEQQAKQCLRDAPRLGSEVAIEEARRILDQAVTKPVAEDLRARVFALAESLYQSIGMQLSVDRYAALAVSRGANLDSIDCPLNERFWLERSMEEARQIGTEPSRLAALDKILNRTNPGPGGFYDDLGNVSMQPHLVDPVGYDADPGGFRSPRSGWEAFDGGFIGRSSIDAIRPDGPARFLQNPKAWWDYVETQYETPLVLRYEHLDPQAQYRVRVVFAGRFHTPRVQLVANDGIVVSPPIEKPVPTQPVEFDIPAEATKTGVLTLRWSIEAGAGGFNGSVGIAEVFLMRK